MTVSAARRNTVSALFKNGKFDLTLPSKQPNLYMEFQHETNTILTIFYAICNIKVEQGNGNE